MPVKYRINYANYFDQQCRVDISNDNYFGDPIILKSAEGQACVRAYECENENDPIVSSNCTTTIMAQSLDQIDIKELQTAMDRDFRYEQFEENMLKWSGFVVPDGVQRLLKSEPFDLTITATDGLKLLENIDYVNYTEFDDPINTPTILNYIRKILFFSLNLNLPLPLRWVNTLRNQAFPLEEDVFMGSVRWSVYGEGYVDYQGNSKSCLYILEGILRSMRCHIYQANGKWNVERLNDVATGIYTYREIPATLVGNPTPTIVTDYSALKYITSISLNGDYSFIEDDAVLTSKQGLKAVKATYQHDQRENIVPNGGMNQFTFEDDQPIFWQMSGDGTIERINSIYDRNGSSVKVTGAGDYFEMDGELPIDSEILYPTINFGFKFSPIDGFPLNMDDTIQWEAGGIFEVQVKLSDNGINTYYLNEFGFFTTTPTTVKTPVENMKIGDVGNINFDKFQGIPLPYPQNPIYQNENPPSIKVSFFMPTGQVVAFDDIYIKVDNNNDVYEVILTGSNSTAKEEIPLTISTSHNGFYVSNFQSKYDEAGLEMNFIETFPDTSFILGTLTRIYAEAVLRSRQRPVEIFNGSIYGNNWNYGECYEIVTLDDKKFIPLNASYNTETCTATIELMESINDQISSEFKRYGTNDNTSLSN